jgi:predicted outer membrane repeat protein
VEIHDSTFESNAANDNGGAIYIQDGGGQGTAEIYDSTFESNTADAVSASEAVRKKCPDVCTPIPGGPYWLLHT